MDTENKAGMEQAIRGAEGLLEMGLYTEAEAVFRRLAQEAPEQYRDLVVRVAGYSTYFVTENLPYMLLPL